MVVVGISGWSILVDVPLSGVYACLLLVMSGGDLDGLVEKWSSGMLVKGNPDFIFGASIGFGYNRL
jgi:hypothetical protein